MGFNFNGFGGRDMTAMRHAYRPEAMAARPWRQEAREYGGLGYGGFGYGGGLGGLIGGLVGGIIGGIQQRHPHREPYDGQPRYDHPRYDRDSRYDRDYYPPAPQPYRQGQEERVQRGAQPQQPAAASPQEVDAVRQQLAGLNRTQVLALQTQLERHGYGAGDDAARYSRIDGIAGPKTLRAVFDIAQANGFDPRDIQNGLQQLRDRVGGTPIQGGTGVAGIDELQQTAALARAQSGRDR